MRTDLKKWLPVMIMAVAVAGAFTTHAMSVKAEADDLVDGRIHSSDPQEPCAVKEECTTTVTGNVCTVDYIDNGTPLFLKVGSQCTQELYRPIQQ
ncbi:DUF6520 family protein [Galbibacter sp. EGI 63066]|uniref:DUF6520 family protein n=1 Tax=Galbibacter sp. EGI 63066 TaxID=2993559 RepID=UPI002248918F|nr:DUF6520 family protein [Galbibacter sp. EGI 63066]MCX2680641.1 DUF6520 family protein [Galbibacter sp. EGI 63066]